jgi:hypothetical protein
MCRSPGGVTFKNWSEYLTILGFGLVMEEENTKETVKDALDIKLRLMSINGAGNRRYFGFIESSEDRTALGADR